jgi:AcrR family transcriptional regulator
MRADAQRNLTAILSAAREAFAAGGLEVGVADIAKRAGVGTATVFRRFATKEELICAVCEQRFREMSAIMQAAEAEPDAWTGLRGCLEAAAETQIADRGLCEAISQGIQGDPRIAGVSDDLTARLEVLLRRAQSAGDVRTDVDPLDLPILINAVARMGLELERVAPGAWRRYLDIVLDGLRPGAPALSAPAPTPAQVGATLAGS